MEVWNGIWKKILLWNGRFLVWNGNGRKLPVWNMENSSSIPFHTMPWLLGSLPLALGVKQSPNFENGVPQSHSFSLELLHKYRYQCSHYANFFQRICDLLEQRQVIFGNMVTIALENSINL